MEFTFAGCGITFAQHLRKKKRAQTVVDLVVNKPITVLYIEKDIVLEAYHQIVLQ